MREKKLRVLLVSPYDAQRVGGIGTWSKLMLEYTSDRNDIELLFLNTANSWKRWALQHPSIRVVVGIVDSLVVIFSLFVKILKRRPQVIHYTSSASVALIKDYFAAYLAKLFHIPFVIHWRCGRIPSMCIQSKALYWLFNKVMELSTASIVLDETTFSFVNTLPIKTPLYRIPNPVSKKLQDIAESTNVEDEFISRKKGTILFVGHIMQTKGVYELVQACLPIDSIKQLILVGPIFDHNVKSNLIEMTKNRGKEWLVFSGEIKREEVFFYYKTCTLFCLPSYTEGFPNAVLEAMAFGCPIVATKVGAVPEILDKDCGILVEAKEVEPLRSALKDVLDNNQRAREIAGKAHNKVLSEYTIDKVFKEYYSIWNGFQDC